jgi:hypothetical protein
MSQAEQSDFLGILSRCITVIGFPAEGSSSELRKKTKFCHFVKQNKPSAKHLISLH